MALLFDVAVILVVAIMTGVVYHTAVYGNAGHVESYLLVGCITALAYTLSFLFRQEYSIHAYVEGHRDFRRTFIVWNAAILSLAIMGFLTKSTDIVPRGGLVLFYAGGLMALTGFAALTRSLLVSLIASGHVASRRIMLVGPEDEVGRIQKEVKESPAGVRIVATQVLPHITGDRDTAHLSQALGASLQDAVRNARVNRVDDIILLTDWSRTELIHHIIEAFTAVPAAIHLGASGLLGRFSDVRVSRLSMITALSVTTPPLGPVEAAVKRTFDLVLASTALILLSPLFAVIAMAIKMTSPGPVFFRQRRSGYNSREFRIWKFRTMNTLDDGPVIKQAMTNDARVTMIGRYLRRFNLDELPQLINVLRGEMSLVGPRPHAVAHDRFYESRILSYPRRLNVKPGITGWAQVNGCRGPTENDESMRARVEYDLYYIDNWSVLFDLYIIALTVLSPKAFRNAL